jgi:hypothetical protein
MSRGPFTTATLAPAVCTAAVMRIVMVSNLPFAFEWFDHRFLHRFTRFPSAPFQVRHTPYPASYPKAIGGGADR